MYKGKRFWQQEVDCCPVCGTVSIYFRKQDKNFRCARPLCNSVFALPIKSTKDNRPHIRELRHIYNRRYELYMEQVSRY